MTLAKVKEQDGMMLAKVKTYTQVTSNFQLARAEPLKHYIHLARAEPSKLKTSSGKPLKLYYKLGQSPSLKLTTIARAKLGSPMKKIKFNESSGTLIQCIQSINLYLKTNKEAALSLSLFT